MSYKVFKEMDGVKVYIGLKSGISREIVTSVEHILSDKRLLPGFVGDVTVELSDNDTLRPGEYPLYFHLADMKNSPSSADVVDELTSPLVIQNDLNIERVMGCFNISSRVISGETK
jgi:hypothetical protein